MRTVFFAVPIFVVSDLHLDLDNDGQLFDDQRQGKELARLCERIRQTPGAELVLLGDAFDLTAMLPPEHGLDDFSRRVGVPIEPPPRLPVEQMCARIARDNPIAIEALVKLAAEAPVWLVPGNHDRQLGEPGGAEALRQAGLGAVRIQRFVERSLEGRTLVLMHGHEFDPGNAEPGGPGEAMTACLHHALLPFLRAHGARKHVRMDPDRLVALRPEEAVVTLLQRWLEPDVFRRVLRAVLDLLAENRYLPQPLALLAQLLPADRVRAKADDADRLWERAGATALDCLRGEKRLPHGAPRPDLLVLGHTHMLDWAADIDDRLYVNLGTWTERAADAMGPKDTTLPVVEITREALVLRDLERGGELQRYVVERSGSGS